jgi:hypothetical protein
MTPDNEIKFHPQLVNASPELKEGWYPQTDLKIERPSNINIRYTGIQN